MAASRRNTGYKFGAVAQLGERLLCKQEVIGSIPFSSTIIGMADKFSDDRDDCFGTCINERPMAWRYPVPLLLDIVKKYVS